MSVFGQILTGFDVENAVDSTIDTWLATYLREIERQKSIAPNSLAAIASTSRVNQFAQYQGEPLPALIIVCPGTERNPERDGNQTYRMWFTCGLAIIVEAVDAYHARQLAQLYAAAIMDMLVQHKSLGGFAEDLELGVVTTTDAPADFLRAGCAVARIVFSVLVPGVVTGLAGPKEPDPDPDAWPKVETVHIDAERLTS